MSEELFESEARVERETVADHLAAVAEKLRNGEEITLDDGVDTVTVAVPEEVEFDVELEQYGHDRDTRLELEFELEWEEHGDTGDDLSIE